MHGLLKFGKSAARIARRFPAVAATLVLIAAGGYAAAQSAQDFTPAEETPEQFADGHGRDEAFYSCTACHNFKLVAAQGMNRQQWEDVLDLMVSKHGMNALEGEDRKAVLDYLEATFPPRAPSGGGWQNPFLNR